MRFLSLTILAVLLSSGIANADRNRRDNRRDNRADRRDNRRDNRPVVRDNRSNNRPVVRDNRTYNRPVVRDNRTYRDNRPVVRDNRYRDNRPVVRDNRYRDNRPVVRRHYTGPIRANRRVITRRPLYVNNGRFVFHNGRSVYYRRPVINRHYYDVRFRPQVIVEDYPAQYGYIWISGAWNWDGREWAWTGGHYEPDPAFEVYYDDDSWE